MKRAIIVHGWGGYPEEGWFPWLKKELEKKGLEVFVPKMPDADKPRIQKWVPKLAEIVGTPDKNTYFVGHSMGCQAIARYLQSLSEGIKVGGAVFVAGFFKRLTGMEPEEIETRNHWLKAPLDLNKVKSHLQRSVAIFSDTDPYVPSDNQDDFRDKLKSEIIIKKGWKHFSGSEGIIEFPTILEKILEMAK